MPASQASRRLLLRIIVQRFFLPLALAAQMARESESLIALQFDSEPLASAKQANLRSESGIE